MAITIENRDPESAAVDVPYTTNVYFELVDHVAGSVNLNKVTIVINSVIAYETSTEKNGWSVIVAPVADGYGFTLVPPVPFVYGAEVLVHIEIAP